MMKIIISAMGALMCCGMPAFAQQVWCWSLTGTGVSAAGTLVAGNGVNAEGFSPITAITGIANSATITALQATGTSIPGNAGYPVDNLIRASAPQLTKHGFGFAASDGTYHNPFHLEQYRDYVSRPPYADGKGAEPTVRFRAVTASNSHCPTQ
jgi:hypothetical protein